MHTATLLALFGSSCLASVALVACGGAPFTSGALLADTRDSSTEPDAAPSGDASTPPASDAAVLYDSSPPDVDVDAAPSFDGDVMPDGAIADAMLFEAGLPEAAPPALCCIGTSGNANNVHCAVGVSTPCEAPDAGYSETTYDQAVCGVIGGACQAWPHSSGSPMACGTSEPCCMGITKPCP